MNKPTIDIIRRRLFDFLIIKLEPIGFKFIKSEDGFKRNLKNRIDLIRFNFYYYNIGGNSTAIEPWIYIQEKSIAKLYSQFSVWEKQYIMGKLYSIGGKMTTIYELDDYAPNNKDFGEIRWSIENDSDIDTVLPMISNSIDIVALPYFDKYGSIEAIEKILNDTDNELTKHCSINPLRFAHGLIAAKLTKNPKFIELKNYYIDYFSDKDVPVQWINDFNKIVNELTSPNSGQF
jgi:hypothetical protein